MGATRRAKGGGEGAKGGKERRRGLSAGRRLTRHPGSRLAFRRARAAGTWERASPPPQKTGPATKFANAEINRELCGLAVHDYVEHKRDEGM
eukprot:SAG25_NODE_5954_length_602_cov_0.838966_1_plen_91_part_01